MEPWEHVAAADVVAEAQWVEELPWRIEWWFYSKAMMMQLLNEENV